MGKEKGFGIVFDYTATWCGPCQKIKPRFHELATEYPKHCFVEVDIDDDGTGESANNTGSSTWKLEAPGDELIDCKTFIVPNFRVFVNGEFAGSQGGNDPAKLTELVSKNLGSTNGSKADWLVARRGVESVAIATKFKQAG